MEYIVIPTKDKSETDFFLSLFKKMNKKVEKLTADQVEDIGFVEAMKISEKSGNGNLKNVLSHLEKVIKSK